MRKWTLNCVSLFPFLDVCQVFKQSKAVKELRGIRADMSIFTLEIGGRWVDCFSGPLSLRYEVWKRQFR